MSNKIRLLEIVVHRKHGRGVIVPDPMGLCAKGCYMVDFGNSQQISCHEDDLKKVGWIPLEFNPKTCEGCVFASSRCHRHHNGALGHLLTGGKKIIPMEIYPQCKQEVYDKKRAV